MIAQTIEERDTINASVANTLGEGAMNWGMKVHRYEIMALLPPAQILRSMQAQITSEREKRALGTASEGRKHAQIEETTGKREAFFARSEGQHQAWIDNPQGEESARIAVAAAPTDTIRKVTMKAVDAHAQLAQNSNATNVPGNTSEVSGLIGTARVLMTVVREQK